MSDRRGFPAEALRLAREPVVLVCAGAAMALGSVAPLSVKWLLDWAIPAQGRWMVLAVAAGVGVALALVAGARAIQGWLTARLGSELAVKLGDGALEGLLCAEGAADRLGDAAAFGLFMNIVVEGWGRIGSGLVFGCAAVGSGLGALLVVGFDASGLIALGLLASAGLGMYAVARRQGREIRDIARLHAEVAAESFGAVANLVPVLPTLKTLSRGQNEAHLGLEAFDQSNRLLLFAQEVSMKWSALRTVLKSAGGLAALLALWTIGARSPGDLAAGAGAGWALLAALDGLLGIQLGLEAFWPIHDRLEALRAKGRPSRPGGVDPGPIRELEVRGLWFRYGSGPWVLEGADLHLHEGEQREIQWPSGGGKSTLLRLITGVLVPERGVILVNGIPLEQVDLVAYRQRLGVLTQEPEVLSGTVMEMLQPTLQVSSSEQEAWELLERVEADGIVRALPLGLHTHLIQGGASLSGGEMRRISLARALHRGATLFLLDEPLAGLGESPAWLRGVVGAGTALILGHERGGE